MGATLSEGFKNQLEPLNQELKGSRTLSEQMVQAAGNTLSALAEITQEIKTLGENTTGAVKSVDGTLMAQAQVSSAKQDELNKKVDAGQAQQLAALENVNRTIQDLNGAMIRSTDGLASYSQQQTDLSSRTLEQVKSPGKWFETPHGKERHADQGCGWRDGKDLPAPL